MANAHGAGTTKVKSTLDVAGMVCARKDDVKWYVPAASTNVPEPEAVVEKPPTVAKDESMNSRLATSPQRYGGQVGVFVPF